MNPHPNKPGPRQQFSMNSAAQDLKLRIDLKMTPKIFLEWKPDKATLAAWARAQNPYESAGSDGRDPEKGLRYG